MGRFAEKFKQVGDSKDMVTFEPKLPLGDHLVALVMFGGKESARDASVRVEAEVVILETDNEAVNPGALHSWMWPISANGFAGQYAQDRNKRFIQCVQDSTGLTEKTVADFGDKMDEEFRGADPEMYGVQLRVKVTQALKNGAPLKGKNGDDVYNADWAAVTQGDEDIQQIRATLAEIGFKPKFGKPPASEDKGKGGNASAPSQTGASTSAPPPTATGGSIKKLGLKSLTGK